MQHSVLQSSICIFIHNQNSTFINMNTMPATIINLTLAVQRYKSPGS